MLAERPGFPFRIFLPLSQLLLCLALLWPHLPALRNQLSFAIRGFTARILGTDPPADTATIVFDVSPFSPRREQPLDVSAVRLTAPAALNIPVGFVQIPFMLENPDRSEWSPDGMWIREWRAVSWPFVGMIFWWIAGRALEALSAGMRFFAYSGKSGIQSAGLIHPLIHWIEVAAGACLMMTGGTTCYVLASGRGLLGLATDYVLAAGAGLWSVLGLAIVSAGIMQWRLKRIRKREWLTSAQTA